ncbi:MAG TPA: ribonuclease domain-containing protein [Burkholderiales bacterium]|nr:ribonuclease domain-containing protein [Burkholderiales bacterium]
MRRTPLPIRIFIAVLLFICLPLASLARTPPSLGTISASELPKEARVTLRLIQKGGPYPHRQDDTIFGNRERRLPMKPRGYYHEYTVETPGAGNRGARRIITGDKPPREFYYTDDHYRSFKKIQE